MASVGPSVSMLVGLTTVTIYCRYLVIDLSVTERYATTFLPAHDNSYTTLEHYSGSDSSNEVMTKAKVAMVIVQQCNSHSDPCRDQDMVVAIVL